MKCSEIRGGRSADHPGFRKLHPGYVGYTGTRESVGNPFQSQTVSPGAPEPPLPDATSRPSAFVGRVATKATVCDWKGRD